MIRVLWLDDEPNICKSAVRILRPEHGFTVDTVTDPDEFLRIARKRRHDVLIVDWNLRTCEGTDLIALLRAEGDMRPMALLSGKLDSDHARDLARASGANEFIPKVPASEWAARIKAIVRQPQAPRASGEIRRASVELDGNLVRVSDYTATLRDRERAVLELLLEDPGREFSREEIARKVWGRHGADVATLVDPVISRIREKLGAAHDLIERGPRGWFVRILERKLK